MEVQLCKSGLLLHHHHSALSFLHLLELGLLFSNLITLFKFELVVPFELFFSIASLKVKLNFKIADMSFDLLNYIFFSFFGLFRFHISRSFASFFSLKQLLLFLLR